VRFGVYYAQDERPMSIRQCILTLALAAVPCFATDFENAWHVIRPIIHANDEQKTTAMRSASIVVLAEIQEVEVFDKPRVVEKPAAVGGPMVPTIPLHLARISAKRLLTIRGNGTGPLDFYSWVWASGKHGGPRLFHATPDSVHVLFLNYDSGYLHTVGDYPAYDVEVPSQFMQKFITTWEAGYLQGADLLERIAAVRLKSELESVRGTEAVAYSSRVWELAVLTSVEFVVSQLSTLCTTLANPGGRATACAEHLNFARQ
jgi:hypothetical protein